MGPYDSVCGGGSSSGSSASTSSLSKHPPATSDIDGLLAAAGYKVRSSELRHVAQRLERLETAMADSSSPAGEMSGAVLYNPSDLASWVDSLLSEFAHFPPSDQTLPGFPDLLISNDHDQDQHHRQSDVVGQFLWEDHAAPPTHPSVPPPHHSHLTVVTATEEDSGIRLVHALVTCAEAVQRGDLPSAGSLIENMQALLTRVSVDRGIGKVARCFIGALSRRIFSPHGTAEIAAAPSSGYETEILYHHFYEACPYLKFAHFTANQAILEAFDGHDCVHVIDFNLMHGLQWPALIQALALRPGGPPLLRLTGVGPPSPDGRDALREIGLRLAALARSVNVRFAFRGVAATRLDDVKPWMLHVSPTEALAVNSVFQLHRLVGPDPARPSPLESVLSMVRGLSPKIVTVVEQEANHNQAGFLDRFTEALYYYSTMFDSLESCSVQPEKTFAEMYIQGEICNVVCCEGSARVERHEPLERWRARLGRAGFKAMNLGSNAFKQASMLLTLFSAEGYCVEERDGCLTLGWHSRPLIAASAWQADAAGDSLPGVKS